MRIFRSASRYHTMDDPNVIPEEETVDPLNNKDDSKQHVTDATTKGSAEDDNVHGDPSDGRGRPDEEFCQWIHQKMTDLAPQVQELYPDLFEKCAVAVTQWRKRFHGNSPLWNRLFKQERVIKEVVESIPVIDRVMDWMERNENTTTEKITIIDLCSGKGYLSMLLSEILPPERVQKCLLIDRAWPLCHATPKPHHMSWEHIYGDPNDETAPHYFETWPIPLVTCKQNLKQSREIRILKERFADDDGPVLILAVHLCGTLSIQAVKLFQTLPTAQLLLLKPCCLPDIWHVKNTETFQIGNYCFPAKDVCARGSWTTHSEKGKWKGPPRWHLESKFVCWCQHLYSAMGQDPRADDPSNAQSSNGLPKAHSVDTTRFDVPLQTKGGFQNTFLYAEKE